jgi:hypothetical protein
MPTDGGERSHWKEIIIEANALIWIDDNENWQRWEKSIGWWRKLRTHFLGHILDNRPRPKGPVIGPGRAM